MPSKSRITPVSSRPEDISNPRWFKKEVLKGVFLGNKEAYEDYLRFWDEAVAEGATYTYVVAMIKFREHWTTDSEGKWTRKTTPGVDNEI